MQFDNYRISTYFVKCCLNRVPKIDLWKGTPTYPSVLPSSIPFAPKKSRRLLMAFSYRLPLPPCSFYLSGSPATTLLLLEPPLVSPFPILQRIRPIPRRRRTGGVGWCRFLSVLESGAAAGAMKCFSCVSSRHLREARERPIEHPSSDSEGLSSGGRCLCRHKIVYWLGFRVTSFRLFERRIGGSGGNFSRCGVELGQEVYPSAAHSRLPELQDG